MINLNPCPICGSENVHIQHEGGKVKLTTSNDPTVKEYEQYTGRVKCGSCKFTMDNNAVYTTLDECLEDLAKSWNECSGKMKPCPFCGSELVTIRSVPMFLFVATCEKCGATGADGISRGEALVLWNKRA